MSAGCARTALSRWSLTLRSANVGRTIVDESAIRQAARPLLEDLRDATGETSRWFLIDSTDVALVDTAESIHAVRPVESVFSPGPIPMHATAVGKAAMARWPGGKLTSELGTLRAMTPKTITSHRALRSELRETARRGLGGSTKSSTSTSAALPRLASTAGDRLVGIGVSYPLHRTTPAAIRRYGALDGRRGTQNSPGAVSLLL